MNYEGIILFIGLFFGAFVVFAASDFATVSTLKVKSEKQFIFGNATYICKKTNELTEKK